MPLTLETRHCGNVYIIECKGRLVVGDDADKLEAALDLAARQFTRIVLTVSEISRLDSTGLGLLVRTTTNLHKRGGDIRLAAPPAYVTNLLEMTRLSTVLHTHPTEEEAILSFLKQRPPASPQAKHAPRVLVVDQSADLCAFIRTVLTQHGFDVKSSSLVRDAKCLLQVDPVEYILVGPGSSQLPSQTVAASLQALAPKAITLNLTSDFKALDAHAAAEQLLHLFGASKGNP